MTKDQNQIEDFFHITSRLIIIFPLVIILLALVLKFGQKTENKGYKQVLPSSTIKYNKPNFIDILKANSSPSARLNLKGPFICQLNTSTSSLSAYIKNKKISGNLAEKGKVTHTLFTDDCLYLWQEGNYSGERICGLSSYVNLAETLLSMNLVDFGQILSRLNQFDSSLSALSKNDAKSFINSCKKEEIVSDSIFILPKNVLFKNKR